MNKYKITINLTYFLEGESKNEISCKEEVKQFFKANHAINLQDTEVMIEPILAAPKEKEIQTEEKQGEENGTQSINE